MSNTTTNAEKDEGSDIKSPYTQKLEEKYGHERDEMYKYVCDDADRGYPIEVKKWNCNCWIGIEVIIDDDRLGHYGTLQDIARGAVEDWFLRDLESMEDCKVRIEFVLDRSIPFEAVSKS